MFCAKCSATVTSEARYGPKWNQFCVHLSEANARRALVCSCRGCGVEPLGVSFRLSYSAMCQALSHDLDFFFTPLRFAQGWSPATPQDKNRALHRPMTMGTKILFSKSRRTYSRTAAVGKKRKKSVFSPLSSYGCRRRNLFFLVASCQHADKNQLVRR